MKRTLTAAAVLFALSGGSSLSAQAAPPIVGAWEIEYARGQRVDETGTTNVMAKGKMTVVQSGDSLLATIELPPRPDGTPTPVSTIGGRLSAGNAVFIQKQKVTLNMNGEMHQADAVLTWTLQATADALTGTMAREIPMMGMPSTPSPVQGVRLKS